MFRLRIVQIAAAACVALATPGSAQITEVDPNNPAPYTDQQPEAPVDQAPYDAAPSGESEYLPVDSAPEPEVAAEVPAAVAAGPGAAQSNASARASAAVTVPPEDVFSAAEGVFGKGAEGLADLIEDVLKDQGEPSAYITGKEAGGAFIAGVRYGSGTLHHQVEGDRPIFWTGPSLGFDFGADASKVFVLVYNLNDSQEMYRRYPAGEGKAYVVGGLTAGYLRRGNIVLIPVRMGAGLRLGVNAGYMKFTERNRWFPF